MNFPRRDFLKGSLSALGFSALGGGRVFAVPPDWKPQKRPNIVFGVLADTHFRTDGQWRLGIKSDRYLVSALERFRNRNVDALVHCGDMADRGLVEELQLHADAYIAATFEQQGDGATLVKWQRRDAATGELLASGSLSSLPTITQPMNSAS